MNRLSGVLSAGRGRERWLLAALLLAVLAGMCAKYTVKAMAGRGAIDRWYQQLHGLEEGENIGHQYPNPPVMALLLLPLAHLPPLVGSLCWFWVKVGLTVLGLSWLFRWVAEQGVPFPLWARALTVLLSLRPILGDLEHGNVNLFILFLVLAVLTLYQRGRDLLAGVVLGLAVACKVTPTLFLPYFLWKRSWRALAGSALGLALFLWPGFVPALGMGWQRNQDHLHAWYDEMVHPFIVEGKVTTELVNQSLPGVVYRLGTHSPAETRWDRDNACYVPLRYANLLDLSPGQARWVVKGCMGLFALVVVWCCRTPTTRRGGWRLSAEFSLVVLGMLLFSERTWKHHCVTLVLPFAVLCYHLATQPAGAWLRAYLAGTLAAATLLIASTSNGLFPRAWAEETQIYGAYVLAHLVLAAALVVLLRRLAQPAQPAQTDPLDPVHDICLP
jgi:hypothetical protein